MPGHLILSNLTNKNKGSVSLAHREPRSTRSHIRVWTKRTPPIGACLDVSTYPKALSTKQYDARTG
jgi:hypothetical protein